MRKCPRVARGKAGSPAGSGIAVEMLPAAGCRRERVQGSSSGGGLGVGLVVSEHGVQDVCAASGEGDECRVVFLLLGSFAVVVGAGDGVAQGRERGQEQGSFEDFVAAAGWVFPADGSP